MNDALLKICRGLDRHPSQLFQTQHSDTVVSVQTANNQTWLPRNSEDVPDPVDPTLLALPEQRRAVVMLRGPVNFMSVLDTNPGEEHYGASILELFERSRMRRHFGDEFLYVLAGKIVLTVSGQNYELNEGDAAGIVAAEPHTYTPVGPEQPARILTMTLRRLGDKDGG